MSLRTRSIDACLVAALLATLWHLTIAWPRSPALSRDDQLLGPLMDVGVRVTLPGLWENSGVERTAILVLDLRCPACLSSRPFYAELSRAVEATPGTRLIILTEDPIPRVRRWLDEAGIAGRVVRIPSRKALGILATPTLLLANSEGVVTDVLIGTLDQADSDRFMGRLNGHDDSQPLRLPYSLREISVSEQPTRERWIGQQLVDTRDRAAFYREHSEGAVNIPQDELKVRAPVELRRSLPVFIDCRYGDRADCRLMAGWLGHQGFESVIVVLR